MKYIITHEFFPAKEYLAIKGFLAFGENPPDEYTEWKRTFSELINEGYANNDLIRRLLNKTGADEVVEIFCNNCRYDKEFGLWIVGRDIACENINHTQAGDGFEIIRLEPAEYLKIEYIYNDEITREQALDEIIDYFNKVWIKNNPYESLIEGKYHYDPGTANLSLLEPDAKNKRAVFWNPIKRIE